MKLLISARTCGRCCARTLLKPHARLPIVKADIARLSFQGVFTAVKLLARSSGITNPACARLGGDRKLFNLVVAPPTPPTLLRLVNVQGTSCPPPLPPPLLASQRVIPTVPTLLVGADVQRSPGRQWHFGRVSRHPAPA